MAIDISYSNEKGDKLNNSWGINCTFEEKVSECHFEKVSNELIIAKCRGNFVPQGFQLPVNHYVTR